MCVRDRERGGEDEWRQSAGEQADNEPEHVQSEVPPEAQCCESPFQSLGELEGVGVRLNVKPIFPSNPCPVQADLFH